MYDRLKPFDQEQKNLIHTSAMEILDRVGVAFFEPEALDIFRRHGVRVEGDKVFLTEKTVMEAVEQAPSRFTLRGRDPAKSVDIGEEAFVYLPAYGPPFVIESDGSRRSAVLDDYENICRLVRTSSQVDMTAMEMVLPSDRPSSSVHLDMMLANILLCDKPFMGAPTSRQAAVDALEMAAIAFGGPDEIRSRPVTIPIISATAPLRFTAEMAGSLIEYARAGQALLVSSLIMAGSSGPVTLSGVLALANAETLAGITLAQLIQPGLPVVYGSASSPMDMRTGGLSIGAVEGAVLSVGTAQMARYYGLPSRSGGGLTDAQAPDQQAGIEAAIALTTTVRAGVNFILHACGILASYLAFSFEKFLADEDLCGMARKLIKPMEVTRGSIDLDMIASVGVGGHYLTHPKTLELCRSEFYLSPLMSRQGYDKWRKEGGRRTDRRAADLLAKRLSNYTKPDISPSIEKELLRFVERKRG